MVFKYDSTTFKILYTSLFTFIETHRNCSIECMRNFFPMVSLTGFADRLDDDLFQSELLI